MPCLSLAVRGVSRNALVTVGDDTSLSWITHGAPTQTCIAGKTFRLINRRTVMVLTPSRCAVSSSVNSLRDWRSPSS